MLSFAFEKKKPFTAFSNDDIKAKGTETNDEKKKTLIVNYNFVIVRLIFFLFQFILLPQNAPGAGCAVWFHMTREKMCGGKRNML